MLVSIDASEVHDLASDMGRHIAAFPGEASAIVLAGGYEVVAGSMIVAPVDTGALRASISLDEEDGGLGWEVGPTVEYGDYVERGTSRMGPQPYLGPTYDRIVPGIGDRLADRAVAGIVRAAG